MTYILLCIHFFVYVNVLTISNVQAMYLLVIFLIYDSRYRYLGKNIFLNLYVESNILDISYVRTILVLLIIIFILSISRCKVCTYVLILVVKIICLDKFTYVRFWYLLRLWHCLMSLFIYLCSDVSSSSTIFRWGRIATLHDIIIIVLAIGTFERSFILCIILGAHSSANWLHTKITKRLLSKNNPSQFEEACFSLGE